MDGSGFGGGFLSGTGGAMLDLKAPIHRNQQSPLGHSSSSHHRHVNFMGAPDADHRPNSLVEVKSLNPKCFSANIGKGKEFMSLNVEDNENLSDDDEPNFMEDGNSENPGEGKSKRGTPWQRMKWTDNVVRLLIAVVACVGDDGSLDGVYGLKRKCRVLQKKGKWKMVSKIMIGKGCHVSPQQCEDKFNDLNKRYKRLNDVLGRGTSCKVVENPSLMDSMPHLSNKAKDDVRKILSSKHLFYQEMCAYHNGQRIPNCENLDLQACMLALQRSSKDVQGSEEEGEEGADGNNNSDDNDESDYENDDNADEDLDTTGEYNEGKKLKPSECHIFEVELTRVCQDPTVSLQEREEWIKKQKLHLMEQSFGIQAQALELEKQRFKWLRYCETKNKEFEKLRLENEKMRLENKQRILYLKLKQTEFGVRSCETSSDPNLFGRHIK